MMLNKKWTGSQEVSLSSTGFQIDNAVKTLTSLIQNGQSRLNYSNVKKILNLSKSKKKFKQWQRNHHGDIKVAEYHIIRPFCQLRKYLKKQTNPKCPC